MDAPLLDLVLKPVNARETRAMRDFALAVMRFIFHLYVINGDSVQIKSLA